jgi:hypothetical protein
LRAGGGVFILVCGLLLPAAGVLASLPSSFRCSGRRLELKRELAVLELTVELAVSQFDVGKPQPAVLAVESSSSSAASFSPSQVSSQACRRA